MVVRRAEAIIPPGIFAGASLNPSRSFGPVNKTGCLEERTSGDSSLYMLSARLFTRRFLEETGDFSLVTVTSALQAIEILNQEHYDSVMSDYQMPGMNRMKFLQTLRKSGSTMPFILFSGRSRESIMIKAIHSGAGLNLNGKNGQGTCLLSWQIMNPVSRESAGM